MSKQTGLGDRLYINGYDISGDVGAADSISTPRNDIDVTGMDKSAHERILGLADVNVAFTAFYNDASGRAHTALSGLESTNRLTLYSRGSTKGQASLMFNAKQMNYDPTRAADGSLTITVNLNGADGAPPEWGKLLSDGLITQANSTETDSRDDSARSTNGLAAQIQVTAASGTTGSNVFTIEDSTDGSVWATLKAFSAISASTDSIPGYAERVTVSGDVERFLRIHSTLDSTGISFVVATRRGSEGVSY